MTLVILLLAGYGLLASVLAGWLWADRNLFRREMHRLVLLLRQEKAEKKDTCVRVTIEAAGPETR